MLYALIYTVLGSIFSTWFAFHYGAHETEPKLNWRFWFFSWFLWPLAAIVLVIGWLYHFCRGEAERAKAREEARILKIVQDAFKQ